MALRALTSELPAGERKYTLPARAGDVSVNGNDEIMASVSGWPTTELSGRGMGGQPGRGGSCSALAQRLHATPAAKTPPKIRTGMSQGAFASVSVSRLAIVFLRSFIKDSIDNA